MMKKIKSRIVVVESRARGGVGGVNNTRALRWGGGVARLCFLNHPPPLRRTPSTNRAKSGNHKGAYKIEIGF